MNDLISKSTLSLRVSMMRDRVRGGHLSPDKMRTLLQQDLIDGWKLVASITPYEEAALRFTVDPLVAQELQAKVTRKLLPAVGSLNMKGAVTSLANRLRVDFPKQTYDWYADHIKTVFEVWIDEYLLPLGVGEFWISSAIRTTIKNTMFGYSYGKSYSDMADAMAYAQQGRDIGRMSQKESNLAQKQCCKCGRSIPFPQVEGDERCLSCADPSAAIKAQEVQTGRLSTKYAQRSHRPKPDYERMSFHKPDIRNIPPASFSFSRLIEDDVRERINDHWNRVLQDMRSTFPIPTRVDEVPVDLLMNPQHFPNKNGDVFPPKMTHKAYNAFIQGQAASAVFHRYHSTDAEVSQQIHDKVLERMKEQEVSVDYNSLELHALVAGLEDREGWDHNDETGRFTKKAGPYLAEVQPMTEDQEGFVRIRYAEDAPGIVGSCNALTDKEEEKRALELGSRKLRETLIDAFKTTYCGSCGQVVPYGDTCPNCGS